MAAINSRSRCGRVCRCRRHHTNIMGPNRNRYPPHLLSAVASTNRPASQPPTGTQSRRRFRQKGNRWSILATERPKVSATLCKASDSNSYFILERMGRDSSKSISCEHSELLRLQPPERIDILCTTAILGVYYITVNYVMALPVVFTKRGHSSIPCLPLV